MGDSHLSSSPASTSVSHRAPSSPQRKLKGFTIARMYHQVGEQRTARQYLTWYLEARPSAAPAHKLLGQVLAASGEPAPALAEYAVSLELDSHQKDLVMTGKRCGVVGPFALGLLVQ